MQQSESAESSTMLWLGVYITEAPFVYILKRFFHLAVNEAISQWVTLSSFINRFLPHISQIFPAFFNELRYSKVFRYCNKWARDRETGDAPHAIPSWALKWSGDLGGVQKAWVAHGGASSKVTNRVQ